jgi:hypothetical protein
MNSRIGTLHQFTETLNNSAAARVWRDALEQRSTRSHGVTFKRLGRQPKALCGRGETVAEIEVTPHGCNGKGTFAEFRIIRQSPPP